MADAAPVNSWAPLRFTVFRALWIAALVGNIGNWMQTVGAQWFLVHEANAAILVALVQVADTLPDALFGLVGGVLADISTVAVCFLSCRLVSAWLRLRWRF